MLIKNVCGIVMLRTFPFGIKEISNTELRWIYRFLSHQSIREVQNDVYYLFMVPE